MDYSINISFSDIRLLKYIYMDQQWQQKIMYIRRIFKYSGRVNVILFENCDELSKYLGVKIPEWVTGTYYENTIMIIKYEMWKSRNIGNFSELLLHEFTHVIVNEKTKSTCPKWLNEGLALYFAGQYKGMYLNDKSSLDIAIYELDYCNKDFYNICAKVVEKLMDRYGVENILFKLDSKLNYINDNILGEKNLTRLLKE